MIKAKKSLGQNFLVDSGITRRILATVSPQPEDIIIEIGPGTGSLTRLLTEKNRVIAIEIDRRLIEELKSLSQESLTLIEADALVVDWPQLIDLAINNNQNNKQARIRIVANLPYYIATPIIERLVALRGRVYDLTLMLQKEVAERITTGPGSKEYGYLSVLVQCHCLAKRLFDVPPSAFRPVPKVQSTVVNLLMRKEFAVNVADEKKFMRMVSALFSQRRKTIANNLKSAISVLQITTQVQGALERSGIDPRRRAETLSLDEFASLYRALFEN